MINLFPFLYLPFPLNLYGLIDTFITEVNHLRLSFYLTLLTTETKTTTTRILLLHKFIFTNKSTILFSDI